MTIRIEIYRHTPVQMRNNVKLFRHDVPQRITRDNAENIMSGVKIKCFDKYLFKILDYMNPYIVKYPKIGNRIVSVFEKVMKFNNKFS